MKKKAKKKKNKAVKFVKKTLGLAALAYAGLFCVFYYDLDGKLLYYVVEPFMKNHFDNMERRDPTWREEILIQYRMSRSTENTCNLKKGSYN